MNEKQRALLRLPAKRVESILRELAQVRRRANEGDKVVVPLVTLHLSSGRDLSGWVIDASDDRHSPALILHTPGSDSRQPRHDVTYLDREKIDAVTVHDAADLADVLSFGAIDRNPDAPVPTKLELSRGLADISRSLEEAVGAPMALEIDWTGMPDHKDALYALGETVHDVAAAMKKIAEDDFGREEIKKRVRRIRVEHGEGPKVVREEDLVHVICAFGAGKKGRFDRVSLIVAIGAEL